MFPIKRIEQLHNELNRYYYQIIAFQDKDLQYQDIKIEFSRIITELKDVIEDIIRETTQQNKILLVGEPGSGKSWLIESLQKSLHKKGIKSVRHYCYTKLDDLLQKERIQLNIFYGNLIHDILQAFPELKEVKEEKTDDAS